MFLSGANLVGPRKPATITITPDGDLELRLFQPPNGETIRDTETFSSSTQPDVQIPGRVISILHVSRQVLIDNSRVFGAEFMHTMWAESAKKVVDIEVDTPNSVEVVLRALHGTMTREMLKVDIKEHWEVIQFCDVRQIDLSHSNLRKWFSDWLTHSKYQNFPTQIFRQLLFPAYMFNHAVAFAFITRELAYKVANHITEVNPTEYRKLHLDGKVIGVINGAKGSLKSRLLREVFDPISSFLHTGCECEEATLFQYLLSLSNTGIWPLSEHHKKSLHEIINSPGFVNFRGCKLDDKACQHCIGEIEEADLKYLRERLLKDFHGLCLDCMKQSSRDEEDDIYWTHDWMKKWDNGCRIRHERGTWYHSFMGKRSEMDAHQSKKRGYFSGFTDRNVRARHD